MSECQFDALSVSQLNEYVKALMDSDPVLSEIAVRGEISNFKLHYSSGHMYFSLKDAKCTVKCVMFAQYASALRFRLEEGMKVIVLGRASVYQRDGAYQVYASYILPDGVGEQYLAFEKLKEKLTAEGLFDEERKKPIPVFPRSIGVVTSKDGAALRDIVSVIHRRFPFVDIVLYPALVQGSGAPATLCQGIDYFNFKRSVDVIIVGRGGGSREDLSCFNDEGLARTIAASDIPVISAVGHETDFSISDFVADLRAPTPSVAAELAVPDVREVVSRLNHSVAVCKRSAEEKFNENVYRLKMIVSSDVMSSPARSVEKKEQQVEELRIKITNALSQRISNAENELQKLISGLHAMDPLAVLDRGYAVVSLEKTGLMISDAGELSAGDEIGIRFRDGAVRARVEETSPLTVMEEKNA